MPDRFQELRQAAREYGYPELEKYLSTPEMLAFSRSRRLSNPLLMVYAILLLIIPVIYVGSSAMSAQQVGTLTPSGTYVGSDQAWPATGCDPNPGAPAGSSTLGYTSYSSSTTVTNKIFDAGTDDDMINVTGGHVIFDHVTFKGHGTGSSGSSLEVSGSGTVEVRNSRFEGSPTEDYVQTKSDGTSAASVIECNRFVNAPGEDDIDMKSGGPVTVQNNTIQTCATGGDTFIMQNSTNPIYILNNTGVMSIFMTNGHSDGEAIGNQVTACDSTLWVYDVSNVLIQGNTVDTVKNGESGTSRSPSAVYYKNNSISTFQKNGGTCYKDGNTGNSLSGCTSGPPSWYP
jgi:hypothetical protein